MIRTIPYLSGDQESLVLASSAITAIKIKSKKRHFFPITNTPLTVFKPYFIHFYLIFFIFSSFSLHSILFALTYRCWICMFFFLCILFFHFFISSIECISLTFFIIFTFGFPLDIFLLNFFSSSVHGSRYTQTAFFFVLDVLCSV